MITWLHSSHHPSLSHSCFLENIHHPSVSIHIFLSHLRGTFPRRFPFQHLSTISSSYTHIVFAANLYTYKATDRCRSQLFLRFPFTFSSPHTYLFRYGSSYTILERSWTSSRVSTVAYTEIRNGGSKT